MHESPHTKERKMREWETVSWHWGAGCREERKEIGGKMWCRLALSSASSSLPTSVHSDRMSETAAGAISSPEKKRKEEKVIQILSSISLHSPHIFCEKAIHLRHMYTYALPTSTDPSLLQMARYSVLGGRGKGRVGLGSGKRGSLLSQGSLSGMAYASKGECVFRTLLPFSPANGPRDDSAKVAQKGVLGSWEYAPKVGECLI